MSTRLTRREFLKLAGASAAGLYLNPNLNMPAWDDSGDQVRVAIHSISVYSQAWDKSRILFQRLRDDVLHVYETVTSDHGPAWNPIWYRVWGGYVHSGSLQHVRYSLNPVQMSIPEQGLLAQITVPWIQSLRYTRWTGWEPLYRLYYESQHWIMGVDDGPDGQPWYRLMDELLHVDYHVPATTMRPIRQDEMTPIAQDVPADQKRIEVSLGRQTVVAYEGDKAVFTAKCSSGVPNRAGMAPGDIPTQTPKGRFHIQNKMPSKHMGDGKITADLEAYELPGIPWVSFFEPMTGVAFHGTYWHTNFGIPMSHGCVNLTCADALWIYRWSTPVTTQVSDWDTRGLGTLVIVS
ncbi:MAG TPA: L,D-transpeptidase [Anaerolineaceae bacterium]|nr:L,D-transpeptidase [Anaerolineaceae bacterium]